MALKIGKFYITRNNPRALLKKICELLDEKADLIEWLETYAEFNTDEQPIEKTINEVLDKIRGGYDERRNSTK